jgi:DNA invertase Pin-like site-specific DNA recombinase
MKVAIYARVSKAVDQDPESQLRDLRDYVKRAGYEVEGEYIDEISSKDTRPAKESIGTVNAMLEELPLEIDEIDG